MTDSTCAFVNSSTAISLASLAASTILLFSSFSFPMNFIQIKNTVKYMARIEKKEWILVRESFVSRFVNGLIRRFRVRSDRLRPDQLRYWRENRAASERR